MKFFHKSCFVLDADDANCKGPVKIIANTSPHTVVEAETLFLQLKKNKDIPEQKWKICELSEGGVKFINMETG